MSEEPAPEQDTVENIIKSSWDAGGFVIKAIGGVIIEMPELYLLATDEIEASPDYRMQTLSRMMRLAERVFPGLILPFCEENKNEIESKIAEWKIKDAELLKGYIGKAGTTSNMLDGKESVSGLSKNNQIISSIPERADLCYDLYSYLYKVAAANGLVLHTSKENRKAGAEISNIITRT